jgi:glycogen phosphorylase
LKAEREYPNHYDLPKRIERLKDLAYNLWWVWNPQGQRLFSYIDRQLWEALNHNPIAFLRQVDQAKLEQASRDATYLDDYQSAIKDFDAYLNSGNHWFKQTHPDLQQKQIAYFSFEFGLHESMPFYAGGLGILAGDHLKEASDLGMPVVGMGFIYHQGYFVQDITEDGWQETRHYHFNFTEMPIISLKDELGKPLMVSVELPGRNVLARVWEIRVGRTSLFLLDSNVEQNSTNDRHLTSQLYTNDLEIRISQEMLLGLGGVRALRLLGYTPDVWHMNEGHSAFLTLERVRELMVRGRDFQSAVEQLRGSNVFTTHTPVPAGNDQFPLWLIDKYFPKVWGELGLNRDQFIELGKQSQTWGETFSMPVLALKLSENANAVSKLHGEVARKMWSFLWPDRAEKDIPIQDITNGVHTGTWLARRMRLLFERYLGSDWYHHVDEPGFWKNIDLIPDEELWNVKRHLKRKLILHTIEETRRRWQGGKIQASQVIAEGVMLDPYSLTIGFARRFATYKRSNLIFTDYDRLLRIVTHSQMPVQIIFAGKAHPADEPGKLLIQKVYRSAKDPKTCGRLVFLEDYDMNTARLLVQGVDIWLNTPLRPNEASGTSGMKAALNGTLNLSILDGWFAEGFNGKNGWAIGSRQDAADPQEQDHLDAASLYDQLEKEIIPMFYQTHAMGDYSTAWLAKIKECIRSLAPQFSTRRMIKEYLTRMYLPAMNADKPVK